MIVLVNKYYGALLDKTLRFFKDMSKEKQEYYNDGMFVCPKCGRKFTRWANLKSHLKREDLCEGTGKIKRNSDSNSESIDIELTKEENEKGPKKHSKKYSKSDSFEPTRSDTERLSVLLQNDHNFVVLPHDGIKLEDSGFIANQNNDDPLAM